MQVDNSIENPESFAKFGHFSPREGAGLADPIMRLQRGLAWQRKTRE